MDQSEPIMDNDDENADDEDYHTLFSFAQKINSFSATLAPSERHVLMAMLMNLMDPVERMRWRDVNSLLKPSEIEFLEKLQSERG